MVTICENPRILKIILFSLKIFKYGLFIIPVLLILKIMIDIFKNVYSPEEMKIKLKLITKRIVSVVIIFLVPSFVNLLLNIFIDNGASVLDRYNACVTNTKNISFYEAKYDALLKQEDQKQQEENAKNSAKHKLFISMQTKIANDNQEKLKSQKTTTTISAASKNYKVLLNPSHQIHNETTSSNKSYATEKLSMYIFAEKVKNELKSRGYEVYLDSYNGDSVYNAKQTVKLLNESNAKHEEVIYLALHSNATGTSIKKVGPEVYYASSSSKSKKLSESICNTTFNAYKNNNMQPTFGVSSCIRTSNLAEPKRFYSNGGQGAAVLIEIGYHDNKVNQNFIEQKGNELAKAVIDGVDNYLGLK